MISQFLNRKNDKIVFFVRGYQRSGTNWVSNLLNLHKDINCTGEFHLKHFYNAYNNTLKRKHGLLKQDQRTFTKLFNEFIKNVIITFNEENKLLLGDRTPMALDELILPNAKYILIQRDGRDVLVSWIYHLFRINHSFGDEMDIKKELFNVDNKYFENNKKELISNKWVHKISKGWNNRILSDYKTMANRDINVYSVKYEELLKETNLIRKKMYQFLELNPAKANKLTNLTKPGFLENDLQSHYRKGEAGRWREYLTDQQLILFEKNAQEALTLLSYDLYSK